MNQFAFRRTKLACFSAYFTMSSVFSLPPLLFVTFHRLYGISYTLLGTLVLTNFCTQLAIDLVFTLFSKHFNVKKVIRVMPLITSLGLVTYALVPYFLPQFAYGGLLLGTVIFSVSAGLSEVLLSPVIAAIPSDDPQREMSKLHSLYAFGVVTVVVISTLYLRLFGGENWMWLTLFWAAAPVIASVLFSLSPMPDMAPGAGKGQKSRKGLLMGLFVACIFFGSCAENAMGNWISTFAQEALGIHKTLGDILGVAMFAVLLGMTRLAYAKFGKRIWRTLMLGMAGAALCYLAAGLFAGRVVPFVACALAGACVAMLWPGALIIMEEHLPHVGVGAYALMAAGGDLGASLAPQMLGMVVDSAPTEQLGLRWGMLVSALFPLLGVAVLLLIRKATKKR